MSQPFYPPSPAAASSSSVKEIETFNRRYFPLFFFALSSFTYGFLFFQCIPALIANFDINCLVLLSTTILTILHYVYTIILLIAPRFLFREIVWLKTSPWILSGLGLSFIYCFVIKFCLLRLILCILVSMLQMLQYAICIMESEQSISFLFKPFEKKILPNAFAKINLADQNLNLDDYFGPSILISSAFPGQRPSIIRYGSQATPKPSNFSNSFENPPEYNFSVREPSPLSPFSQSQSSINQFDIKN